MAKEKSIHVIVKPDGTCIIDAENFTGTECVSAIDEILQSLGVDNANREAKPELRVPISNREGQRASR